MFDAIATVLAWFYSLCGSYGGAIMLLTLAIMVVLTPLTLKGTRSMLAMQKLQPELRKLQTKYKDDREKLNQELMAFYKENSINPVGGCLPLLIQMPVFFVLYRVLFGLTRRHPYGRDLGASFNQVLQGGDGTVESFGNFDPDHLDRGTRLFEDLSQTHRMGSFGMDLAESAQQVLSSGGIVKALPYIVLVLIVAATSYVQQKQVSGRNPQGQSAMNQQQQMLLKIMPLFFVFISFTLPAGIVLYFVVSNLFRVGQQAFITRTMYADASSGAKVVIDTTAADTTPAGGAGLKGLLSSLRPQAGGSADAQPAKRQPASGARPAKPAPPKPSGRTKGGGSTSSSGSKNGAKGAGGGKGSARPPAAKAKPARPAANGASGERTGGAAASPPVAEGPGTSTSVGKARAPSRHQRPAPPRPPARKKRK